MQEGLDEPFGIMLSDPPGQPRPPDPKLELLVSNLRGPHPVAQFPVAHNGFTDFVVFNPQATAADPALGGRFDAFFPTAVDTEAGGTAALAAQRRFLVSFMERHLAVRGHRHERRRAGGAVALVGVGR